MRRSERLAEGPPALLQKLYGSDQVLSLRDFLLRLCESSPDAKQVLNKRLLQPYDHRDYSKLVLSDVLCIVDRSAQLPSSKFTLAQFSSQVEVWKHFGIFYPHPSPLQPTPCFSTRVTFSEFHCLTVTSSCHRGFAPFTKWEKERPLLWIS